MFKVDPKIRSARRDGRLRRRKFIAREVEKALILSLTKGIAGEKSQVRGREDGYEKD